VAMQPRWCSRLARLCCLLLLLLEPVLVSGMRSIHLRSRELLPTRVPKQHVRQSPSSGPVPDLCAWSLWLIQGQYPLPQGWLADQGADTVVLHYVPHDSLLVALTAEALQRIMRVEQVWSHTTLSHRAEELAFTLQVARLVPLEPSDRYSTNVLRAKPTFDGYIQLLVAIADVTCQGQSTASNIVSAASRMNTRVRRLSATQLLLDVAPERIEETVRWLSHLPLTVWLEQYQPHATAALRYISPAIFAAGRRWSLVHTPSFLAAVVCRVLLLITFPDTLGG
jgi:hypothetical protein